MKIWKVKRSVGGFAMPEYNCKAVSVSYGLAFQNEGRSEESKKPVSVSAPLALKGN